MRWCAVWTRRGALLALVALCAVGVERAVAVGTEDDEAWRMDPDLAAGKGALDAKDWDHAIRHLEAAALRDTRNADIQNYLGFAHRQRGDIDAAFVHYDRALHLDPRHRGAHAYLGEAYLMQGNVAKAEEHLAALRGICLIPCGEVDTLARAIDTYRAGGRR